MKRRLVSILLVILASSVWAQSAISTASVIDGKISAGEYTFTKTDSGITVAARLSVDAKNLFIAVSAPTTGWVAIGLGSRKMSGAFMVLGFVSDGKQTVSTEMGKGYTHTPVASTDVVAVVVEDAGVTTLELSLPAVQSVKAGAVAAIAAFGRKDNAKSIHSKNTSLDIRF